MNAVAHLVPGGAFDTERGMVATPDQILRWLSIAVAGDRFLYAYRYCLPQASLGGAQMRKLLAAGMVTLTQKRCDLHPSEFRYYAVRTARPLEDAQPKRAARSRLKVAAPSILDGEAAEIDALYPVLVRAARFGRPCPTDAQLSSRSGVPAARIAAILAAMSACHLIRIQRVSAPTHRLVTIVATGDRTGVLG